MAGARRQIFVVFAAFMMVEKFGFAVEEITASTIDPDFARNSKIHRAWKIMAR